MSKQSELIKKYLIERNSLMNSRWLTFKSWNNRSREKTRYDEIQTLLEKEQKFNDEWLYIIKAHLKNENEKENSASSSILLIDTHIKKHKEREVFIVIFGAVLAVAIKSIFPTVIFGVFLVAAAFLLASERIFTSNTTTALEELKQLIEEAVDNEDVEGAMTVLFDPMAMAFEDFDSEGESLRRIIREELRAS